MMRRGGGVSALFLAVSLWSAEVAAQVEASEVGLAAAAYERGMESLNRQRYADAIVEFRESYRRNPVPDVLFNLALAFRGAGRIAAALGAFERYLAAAPANAPPERLRAITQIVPQLEQQVGHIQLHLEPTSATLRIDGRSVSQGAANEQLNDFGSADQAGGLIRLDPGQHTIEASMDGYRAASHEVLVRSGSTERLEIVLAPTEALPRNVSEPAIAMGASPHSAGAIAPVAGRSGATRVAAIAVGAAGVVGLSVGVAAFVLRNEAIANWNSYQEPGSSSVPLSRGCLDGDRRNGCTALNSDISLDTTVGAISMGVGGALMVTSVVLFAISMTRREERPVSWICSPSRGGGGCEWRF